MTTKRRRRFTADFKKRVALEALRGDRTVQAIAAKHEVHPNQVGTWKRQAVEGLDEVFARGGSPGPSEHEATIRDLHAKIGELTMKRDFFQRGLQAMSRPARRNLVDRDGALSIRRQCELMGISRSSVYYAPRGESAENLALMRRMDALSRGLQYPFYGSRQMARHLRREGVAAGRRRVRRLMGLIGLLGEALG